MLDQISEEGLDRKPAAVPPGLEQAFDSIGNAFLLFAMHQMNHRGQLCDARRAAGRAPMFTPKM
jgi:hypothetical protein